MPRSTARSSSPLWHGSPGDATCDALVEYYRLVAGEHPDWDEYRQAMVEEGRLLATFVPSTAVGQIH